MRSNENGASGVCSFPSAKNVSGYTSIRLERCKIDWRGAGTPIEPGRMVLPSGKRFIKPKRRSADCYTRQESWAGEKRRDIITRTSSGLNRFLKFAPRMSTTVLGAAVVW